MNTKEEYLKYREDWKKNYKVVSGSIRVCKMLLKSSQRGVHIRPDIDFLSDMRRYSSLILEDKKIATKMFCGV